MTMLKRGEGVKVKIVVYYDGAYESRNPGGVAIYGFVIYADGEKIGRVRV